MPQRRPYSPTPMNAPQTGATGRAMSPPNLQQAPQPLPPAPQTGAMLPQSPMSQSPTSPMMAGGNMTRQPLPSAIPLQPTPPSQPSGPMPNAMGMGTVDPYNIDDFLRPQMDDQMHLPQESSTTSAMLHGQNAGDGLDDQQGGGQIPMALLKMLGTLNR